MDILNWLYLVKKKFTRTSVENPDTDLIALGADVTYAKRGDKYQSYVVPFGSAVAELEGNVLRTGIYDEPPFAIGYPVMHKTTTKVIDTPAAPTFISVDLQGWKVSGSVDISDGVAADAIYLGSIEFDSIPFWSVFPWKTSGQVYAYDDDNGEDVYTPLANGAFVWDDNNYEITTCDFYITLDYYPGGLDIYLIYRGPSPANEIYATASFQFEFLHPSTSTPTFIYY